MELYKGCSDFVYFYKFLYFVVMLAGIHNKFFLTFLTYAETISINITD
jgi:hypothetical protein